MKKNQCPCFRGVMLSGLLFLSFCGNALVYGQDAVKQAVPADAAVLEISSDQQLKDWAKEITRMVEVIKDDLSKQIKDTAVIDSDALDIPVKPEPEIIPKPGKSPKLPPVKRSIKKQILIPEKLSVEAFIRLALQLNPDIQSAEADYEIAKLQTTTQRYFWQPDFEVSADYEANKRENTIEQTLSQLNSVFDEKNANYSAGATGNLPGGANYKVGYTLADLANNLVNPSEISNRQPFDHEYYSFAGINVTQPLLKNGPYKNWRSEIKNAEFQEELTRQEFRRQKMILLAMAQNDFLNALRAQQFADLRKGSYEIAQKLFEDNVARQEQGKVSKLEVDVSRAGVMLRQTRQFEAHRTLVDSMQRLMNLILQPVEKRPDRLLAMDIEDAEAFKSSQRQMSSALARHPDILIRKKEAELEDLRFEVTVNMGLPELNLVGSYGFNGLGDSSSDSFEKVQDGQFDSWSVGLIFSVPFGRDVEERNRRKQAAFRQRKAMMNLKAVQVQVANTLKTAFRQFVILDEYYRVQEEMVGIAKMMLNMERELQKAGKSTSTKVLEAEEDLVDAQIEAIEVRTDYMRSRIQTELAAGTLLKKYGVELKD